MANKFYSNYRKVRQSVVQATEERERSFGEQLFPVFISLIVGTVLIHGFSFIAAVLYPAYHAQLLCGSYAIGVFIGIALILTFIEVPKWVLFSVVFENYFDSGERSYGMALIGIICITASVWSSTNGVPLFVEWYSPEASTEDLALIDKKYDDLEKKAADFWQPTIDKNAATVSLFYKENVKWYPNENKGKGRYRLSSKHDDLYESMSNNLMDSQNSLNERIKEINSQRNAALSETKASNSSILLIHGDKKESATNFAFWTMLLLELVYIFAIAGIKYYKHRSKQELKVLPESESHDSNRTEHSNIVSINKPSDKTEQKTDADNEEVTEEQNKGKVVATDQNKIGYKQEGSSVRQHGKAFVPEGSTTPHVWYYTKKDKWTKYSAATLRRMKKKKDASDEWKSELERLAKNCDNYKTVQ